jgi:hypothetical protein
MLMVDFSGQSWSTQAQDSVRVDNVELFGYRGTFIGVARLSGRRVGSEAMQIRERGQTVQAEKFELKLSLIGNFEAQGIRIPVQYEIPVAMWFAENIGRVAYRIGPGSLNVQPPPLPPQQIKVEGEAGDTAQLPGAVSGGGQHGAARNVVPSELVGWGSSPGARRSSARWRRGFGCCMPFRMCTCVPRSPLREPARSYVSMSNSQRWMP